MKFLIFKLLLGNLQFCNLLSHYIPSPMPSENTPFLKWTFFSPAMQLQRLRKLKTEPLNSPASSSTNLGQTYSKFDMPKAGQSSLKSPNSAAHWFVWNDFEWQIRNIKYSVN